MKKKLEAELISIAHRILKLKNRAELDQLQQETLKLYEKISVLRFVEDNFSDVKPTIGHASAEETLEEIYGIEEVPEVKANEVEAEEEKKRAEEKAKKETDHKKEEKSPEDAENADVDETETDDTKEKNENDEDEAPVAEETPETEEPEGDADPEQKVEEYQASEEEKEHTEEETDEDVDEEGTEDAEEETEDKKEAEAENEPDEDEDEDDGEEEESEEETATEEPEDKVEVVKPEEERRAMEESAAAVFDKEDESSIEEEEKAADAEIITIEPDTNAKTEDPKLSFDFAFDRPAAPEESKKEQKEITFEDYHHDYKEPEFVKKSDTGEAPKETAKPEEPKAQEPAPVRDWRDWEPSQSSAEAEKAAAPKQEEPKKEEPKPASRTLNDSMGKTITLGLNDRIAFEKNLFGGSGEDLNRVLSQLNTFDSLDDAKNFIDDLVKPDYNNWLGKEEYEERFMAIVEKKFE